MLRVALSGGIASGKTTVSNSFSDLGVPVVDADVLARKVVEPNSEGLDAIANRFGQTVINSDATLNRKLLRKIVFDDPEARSDLEAITHPLIRKLTVEQLTRHEKNNAIYTIIVIPLLVETDQQNSYDHIVIVDVEVQTQLDRLMKRDGTTADQAEKILASQASREQRLAVADDVVTNSGDLQNTKAQVLKLHKKLTTLASNIKAKPQN